MRERSWRIFFNSLLEDIAKPSHSCYNKRPAVPLIWADVFVRLAALEHVTKQPPIN